MAERNAARNDAKLWLERIAWNAAALAALGVMLLVLLGTFEWLDHVSRRGATDENRGGRAIRAAAEANRRASG